MFATASLMLVGLLFYINALVVLKTVIGIAVLAVFLYWKVLPYRKQLYPRWEKVMDSLEKGVGPVVHSLDRLPNIKLGDKLYVDAKYLVVCCILLLVLILL